MEKMTPDLLRTYWSRTVSPVILRAKAGTYERVRNQLKAIVPLNMLQTKLGFLPRLTGLVEVPFSKWKEIPTFNMVATVLTPNLIEEVAQWGDVERVYPDYTKFAVQVVPPQGVYKDHKGVPFTSTYWTKRLMGLDRANEKGFTGRDILAVVLDTGARTTHEQLGRVRIMTAAPEKGFSGLDSNGHGSWVSSCVGGARGFDRRYNVPVEGMAPHSDLTSIQVLGFILGMGSSSDIISAMETCIGLDARVINMSLGSADAPKDEDNPEAVAVNALAEKNIIPCIAGGNSGPSPKTIGSPGSCLNALTVAAEDPLTGEIADFSSRGPTAGDGYIKPDVSAPSVRINSALVGFLDDMVDPTQPKYGPISGTCLVGDAIIGNERIKELAVGEGVSSPFGGDVVLAKWYQGVHRVYKVVAGEYELETTQRHLFLIRRGKRYIWLPLIALYTGDEVVTGFSSMFGMRKETQAHCLRTPEDTWHDSCGVQDKVPLSKADHWCGLLQEGECTLEQGEEIGTKPSNIQAYERQVSRPKVAKRLSRKEPSYREVSQRREESILWETPLRKTQNEVFKRTKRKVDARSRENTTRISPPEIRDIKRGKEANLSRIPGYPATPQYACTRYGGVQGWENLCGGIWKLQSAEVQVLELLRRGYLNPETREITKITRLGKKPVYDITTISHTFVANGIIVHNSMATPHVAGLVTCMAQLYEEVLGKRLTVHEVKRMMEELGHEKTNLDGWGFISWDLVERWAETEYSKSKKI